MSNKSKNEDERCLDNKTGAFDNVLTLCLKMNAPIDSKVILAREVPCNNCGECCREENVGLSLTDVFTISKYLDMAPKDFVDKYCMYTVVDDGVGGFTMIGLYTMDGCPFHKDNRCSINEVKPLICRMFPIIDASNTRADLVQHRDRKHPSCAVHQLDPKTLIIPDMDRLVEVQISCGAQLELCNKLGPKKFDARIADGMFHKERMAGKNKNVRKEVIDEQMKSIGEFFGELLKMDAEGVTFTDLDRTYAGKKPYTTTFEK